MIETLDNFAQSHCGITLMTGLKYIFLLLGFLSLIVSIKWFFSEGRHEPINALIGAVAFFVLFGMTEIKDKEDAEKEKNKEKIEKQRFDKLEEGLNKNLHKKEYKASYIITNNSVGGIEVGMDMNEVLKMYNVNNGYIVKNFAPESDSDAFFGGIGIYEKDTSHLLMLLESTNNWQTITQIKVFSEKFHTGNGLHPGMQILDYLKYYPGEEKLYWNDEEDEEFFMPFNFNTKERRLYLVLKTRYIKKYITYFGKKTETYEVQKTGIYNDKHQVKGEYDSTFQYSTGENITYIKVFQPFNYSENNQAQSK